MSSNYQIPCPNCSNHFTQHNPPRKLIKCSHLMCQRCLISQKCCKKCGADIGLNDHFLKDYIIMPLTVNHINCHKKHTSIDKSSLISSNKSQQNQQNQQDRIIRELHQKTEIQNFCNEEFVVEQCLLHSKPADLICIQDRAIICSSCALFGKHKGHQVTNRESILTKFASFIEDCLKIYDNLKQQNRLFSSQIFDSDYRNILQQKLQADQKRISTKFEQIITNIKIIQKKQLLKIRQFYKQKQKTIKIKQEKIEKVQSQVKNWLTQIQNIGSLISDTASLQKISNCIPFIDEKSKLKHQIIEEGENIIQKFIQIKRVYQDQLDLQKQTDYLIFDQTKPKIIQKYVSIKSKTIQPPTNPRTSLSLLHQSPTKQKTPVKLQESMNKKNKSTIKKQHMKTQSDAFNTNLINQKTKVISDFQTNRYVDDNLLLSVQQLISSNKAQQKQNYKNVIIQRVQIAQQLDVQNIPHLSISDIKPANISSGQSSEQSRFLQRDRQLKQFINHDGLMGLTVQFSNNKQEQKKKKKIQFPEKFKGIVDDLKNDRAEIIDLTGAQVGDGSIMGLCSFIKKSKKLKTLKLIKNKISDDCLLQLFQALAESKVCSLNLSQNLLTDKSCAIIQSCTISPNLKTITLSLNKINRRNVKSKIDEFSKKNIAILL